MVENRIEAVSTQEAKSPAADLALLVEKIPVGKTQKEAPIVEVKPIMVQQEYVDPVEQKYIIEKQNLVGTPDNRDKEEGIKVMHKTLHFVGGQAEY